jgi:hypothetical protein
VAVTVTLPICADAMAGTTANAAMTATKPQTSRLIRHR